MSQHIQKFSSIFTLILVSLAVAFALAGCRDELLYNTTEIPDAEVDVEAEIIFRPLVKTEIETRADAPKDDAYKGINSLYVFFFDKDGALVSEYTGNIDNYSLVEENNLTHQRVKFKKRVQAGEYYVFAVANAAHHHTDFANLRSISDLKNFKLSWDDSIDKDLEMFGVFKTTGSSTLPEDVTNDKFESFDPVSILITPSQNKIHSWVRRAVSKVTIDFDGSGLEENVTVYIKNAVLKDIPKSVLLGAESKVTDKSDLCNSQYALNYGTGDTYTNWPSLTRTSTLAPPEAWSGKGFHDDEAMALPCYENMQGVHTDKCKYQDKNSDGIIDSVDKDGVELGTYLEVEGYYVSDRPEYKSQGKIIYRFMLGQNNKDDFNFIRNHHYKITMKFKGYGSDIDWHIVYQEKYLDVSYPQDVNYKGEFFTPDPDYNIPNAGHTFKKENVITITSFETNGKDNTWIGPESVTYTYYRHDDATGQWIVETSPDPWLELTEGNVSNDLTQKEYSYTAKMATPTDSSVDALFNGISSVSNSSASPYNLAAPGKDTSTIEETANCYMVGAPGWYCFPLVYGNGITGGEDISAEATSGNFVNHKNETIKSAYINENVDLSNVSLRIIWQDVEDLVSATTTNLIYDPTLFNNHGGIKFYISSIKEGNAVIALIDNTAGEDEDVFIDRTDHLFGTTANVYGTSGSTKAIWSWHIWATRFGFQFEKDIKILNHSEVEFEIMPVNLGWCADGNIRYYPRRKCDITFNVQGQDIVRTIEQYPYFALPRGDHPYYQWGRKDPFVGTKTLGGNKDRWTYDSSGTKTKYYEWAQYNPPRLYNEPYRTLPDGGVIEDYREDKRHNTDKCLNVLIKNPDKWHNAKRVPQGGDGTEPGPSNPFTSLNESFPDLWSINGGKTIYDPCPPGYMVADDVVFTGFTQTGKGNAEGRFWYDVLEDNMLEDFFDIPNVNTQVLELYCDTRKLQSICFPVSGYRDYDNRAAVTSYALEGHVWTTGVSNKTRSFEFKYSRGNRWDPVSESWKWRGTILDPKDHFYNCDGYAVRPVKIKK